MCLYVSVCVCVCVCEENTRDEKDEAPQAQYTENSDERDKTFYALNKQRLLISNHFVCLLWSIIMVSFIMMIEEKIVVCLEAFNCSDTRTCN